MNQLHGSLTIIVIADLLSLLLLLLHLHVGSI